jgi:C-terminal processing protease CtpA/Prc
LNPQSRNDEKRPCSHCPAVGWKGQTAEARQVLITAVAAVSPADGVLRANDAILGVDGKPSADDARKSFARA